VPTAHLLEARTLSLRQLCQIRRRRPTLDAGSTDAPARAIEAPDVFLVIVFVVDGRAKLEIVIILALGILLPCQPNCLLGFAVEFAQLVVAALILAHSLPTALWPGLGWRLLARALVCLGCWSRRRRQHLVVTLGILVRFRGGQFSVILLVVDQVGHLFVLLVAVL
jgi:hypothetical protein